MTLEGYRRVVQIAALDGLVEASQLARAARDADQAMILRAAA